MSAGRTNSHQTSIHWNTPPVYADKIHEFFYPVLDLDPCSNKHSLIKAKTRYVLPDNDGLLDSWDYHTIFCNPPYGRDKARKTSINDWIRRCYQAYASHDSEVLALVPVATNTRHWKNYIFGKAAAVCFLYDTRLKFWMDGKEDKKGAPMACCMVYWGERLLRFRMVFSSSGYVCETS